ncbi:MAG TPA: SAM-dependent chlorinase/fluorinase [Roseivirga sp.]
MTLITFTSDFGLSDHYVAQSKARILTEYPDANIIDISHQTKPFDLADIAFVISSTYQDFPKGTIHFIGGDSGNTKNQHYLFAEIEEHFFVAPDSGVLSLISEKTPSSIVRLNIEENAYREIPGIVGKIARGEKLESLGTPITEYKQYLKRKSRATKKEISGHVIHVDHYGNLITNIEKIDFDILSRNRKYSISFGREQVTGIQQFTNEVDPGDVFIIFNDGGQMMIGINQGSGSQLLGMEYDSPVIIQFEE